MLPYKIIEIFTSEEAHWRGKPLGEAVVQAVRDLKIAARCQVFRAVQGCYESGEIASWRLEVLSYNMPLRIVIVLPASQCDRVLSSVEGMVTDGIVAVQDLHVVAHRTRNLLFPRQITVRDIMTPDPKRASPDMPLDQVVRLLLSSVFTGLPVVDANNRPMGIITQGDLIYRASMPIRLGLLAESGQQKLDAVLEALSHKKTEGIMTRPVVCIEVDKPLTDAVALMLSKKLKRLPVVDAAGKLAGMLSRLDVFRTAMEEAPDWRSFREQSVEVKDVRRVSDIMRLDTHAVTPETPVQDVMGFIDSNDIQRVAVVNGEGRFLGLISDQDLLAAFYPEHPEGIWDYLASRIPFTERGRLHQELGEHLRSKTAAEVMKTDVVTVREDTAIDEAIGLMVERGLKRLPVLDAEGRFKGMVSRDSLLRTGFGAEG